MGKQKRKLEPDFNSRFRKGVRRPAKYNKIDTKITIII